MVEYHSRPTASSAPKTATWDGTPIVSAALREAVEDAQPLVRAIGLGLAP